MLFQSADNLISWQTGSLYYQGRVREYTSSKRKRKRAREQATEREWEQLFKNKVRERESDIERDAAILNKICVICKYVKVAKGRGRRE